MEVSMNAASYYDWPSTSASMASLSQPDYGASVSAAVPSALGDMTGSDSSASESRLAEERAFARVMDDKFSEACQTCKSRMYQDGSNDPGVSFKTPANIDPDIAASVVMGHEMEHVSHEQAKAKQEGGEVVSQSVVLHNAICPECGRSYVAGGTTTTVTETPVNKPNYSAAMGGQNQTGEVLNSIA